MVPEKVGLKSVQRDGLDYEFTIVLDIDSRHNAIASKDRTSLFINSPEFKISIETGKKIKEWCNQGIDITTSVNNITMSVISEQQLISDIQITKTIEELLSLFHDNPLFQESHLDHFTKRRQELNNLIIQPLNHSTNGVNSNGQHSPK